MTNIEMIFIDTNLYLDDYLVLMLKPTFDYAKLNYHFLKAAKSYSYTSRKCKNLSDDEILAKMVVKKISPPTTFPKFSNEIKFEFKQLESVIGDVKTYRSFVNPNITSIKYDENGWSYQLENIGHKTDYQPESILIKL